jgi:pimeloyl-ACP methyl ester carboxylesterase
MTSDRSIAEVNGTRLVYETAGEGPPVIFLHGYTLDMRMWDDQLPAFTPTHRVVRYDLRGFGVSASPVVNEPYTHADDLHAVLTHLGIERAAVVGLSMGGWVALEFALTYPESVHTLILVDSALRGHAWAAALDNMLGTFDSLVGDGRLAEGKSVWLTDPLFACSQRLPTVAARLEQMVADFGCWDQLNEDPHLPLDPPARERLHDIAAPTLVIVGEQDLADFHDIADRFASEIPNSRKVVLPAAGHMANMDAPEAFNRVVLDFLATVDASRA